MATYPRWKYLLVLMVFILSVIYSLPNFYQSFPSIEINLDDSDRSAVNYEQIIRQDNKFLEKVLYDNKIIFRFSDIDKQLKGYNNLENSTSENNYTLITDTKIPDWLKSINALPMFLGLDLKGGVHFLLQVDEDNILQNLLRESESDLRKLLIANKIRYSGTERSLTKVEFNFKDTQTLSQAEKVILDNDNNSDYVLDVNNDNLSIIITPSTEAIEYDINSSVTKNMTILRNRVNELGVSQPIVQKQGKNRVIVQLPGLQDSTRAKNILGSTATLEFRMTKGTPEDWYASKISGSPVISSSKLFKQKTGEPVLLSRKVIVSGGDIRNANTGFDSSTNLPAVFVRLNDYGASKMLETTNTNIGKRMAVVFLEKDNAEVINIAVIREAFSHNFQITGLDKNEARDLAILLRSGALEAPMEIVEERTVGPSLGKENIISGQNSMYFGMLLVAFFMLIYYRTFGAVAISALVANLLIIISALSFFQATLTLSGIAGIVLTVGMAVDANVLIFERIREEIKNGSTPNASIYSGYQKAFSTISDANITTLIAALCLLTIGTGAVKGFAVTLVIGIISSMFTSIVGTRAVVSIIYERKNSARLSI
tara:strand:- start:65463 stop:67256 length:1794 start_codon:yes stop_codon:yes gene_type:complete